MTIEEFESQLHSAAAELISEFNATFPAFLLLIRTRDKLGDTLLVDVRIGYRDGQKLDFRRPRWGALLDFTVDYPIQQCCDVMRTYVDVWERGQPKVFGTPADQATGPRSNRLWGSFAGRSEGSGADGLSRPGGFAEAVSDRPRSPERPYHTD